MLTTINLACVHSTISYLHIMKLNKLLIAFLTAFIPFLSWTQIRVIPIKSDGYESKVSIYIQNPHVKVNLKKTYAWYVSKEVKETVGGFEGVLLHGKYVSFYEDKQLREEGNYSSGLRNGLWKLWYPNGQLQQTAQWSNGYLNGMVKIYNQSGELIAIENYRLHLKHGIQKSWEDGELQETRYRKGNPVQAKTPKAKKSKKDKPEDSKVVRFKEEKPMSTPTEPKKKQKDSDKAKEKSKDKKKGRKKKDSKEKKSEEESKEE